MRRRRLHLAVAGLCSIALASCGGGERQDKNEPKGRFEVEVTKKEFPRSQSLAKRSDLVITVRNSEARRTIPNVAVTLSGLSERLEGRDLADPNRPVFVINGRPEGIGTYPESKEDAPRGGETAYVGTWALGSLKPGQSKTFRWSVTAVRSGDYEIGWEVAAGLDGKAKAVNSIGETPKGTFAGTISEKAPRTRIADDGRTVIQGDR